MDEATGPWAVSVGGKLQDYTSGLTCLDHNKSVSTANRDVGSTTPVDLPETTLLGRSPLVRRHGIRRVFFENFVDLELYPLDL